METVLLKTLDRLRKLDCTFLKALKRALRPLVLFIVCTGCGTFYQPGQDNVKIYSRVYLTDYNTAWQAAIESLKNYTRPVQNRQGGVIQTGWKDNTAEKNFIDSFGSTPTYLKARYRMNLSVAPGHYNGRPSVKISISKEQMLQRDLLEGWSLVPTDSITENTILYRIGRIIVNKMRLQKIEDEKLKQVIEEGV